MNFQKSFSFSICNLSVPILNRQTLHVTNLFFCLKKLPDFFGNKLSFGSLKVQMKWFFIGAFQRTAKSGTLLFTVS